MRFRTYTWATFTGVLVTSKSLEDSPYSRVYKLLTDDGLDVDAYARMNEEGYIRRALKRRGVKRPDGRTHAEFCGCVLSGTNPRLLVIDSITIQEPGEEERVLRGVAAARGQTFEELWAALNLDYTKELKQWTN